MALNVEQEAILDLLRETRAVALAAVASLDLTTAIDSETTRRGSEILADLAAGEIATAHALAAHLAGTYAAPTPDQPPRATDRFVLWQRQREQLEGTIARLAWADYHQRLEVADGALFIGAIVKRLIGIEQFQLRALLAAAGQPQPFDGSAEQ